MKTNTNNAQITTKTAQPQNPDERQTTDHTLKRSMSRPPWQWCVRSPRGDRLRPEGPEELAWHYTTGECFLRIVEMGMLIPTGIGSTPPERPVLWFSKRSDFEPTAIKAVSHLGEVRQVSLQEMYEMGRGLVRFGYPTGRLLPWIKLREKAKIPAQLWGPLERAARRQGGNPDDWWGTTKGLHVDSLVVDVMDESMAWQRVRS